MALTSAWFHGPGNGLDLGWKNGLVMWVSHVCTVKAKYGGIIHAADALIRQTKPYTAESSNTAEKNINAL